MNKIRTLVAALGRLAQHDLTRARTEIRTLIGDATDAMVLDVPSGSLPGYLEKGNLQTHRDNKCSQ